MYIKKLSWSRKHSSFELIVSLSIHSSIQSVTRTVFFTDRRYNFFENYWKEILMSLNLSNFKVLPRNCKKMMFQRNWKKLELLALKFVSNTGDCDWGHCLQDRALYLRPANSYFWTALYPASTPKHAYCHF